MTVIKLINLLQKIKRKKKNQKLMIKMVMKFIPQKYLLYVVICISGKQIQKNLHVFVIIIQANVTSSKILSVMKI